MAVTMDEALLNSAKMLDSALSALRVKIDPVDGKSASAILDSVRAVTYGFCERQGVTRGVVYGLDACYFSDLGNTWNMFGPPPTTDPLLGGPDGNSLVITRGSLHDGSKYISFEPSEGSSYVHLVTVPDLGGKNCLASGGVYWDVTGEVFKTVIRGSETPGRPPVLLEKSYCTTERFLEAAFGDNPLDANLRPVEAANLIRLARIAVDVSESGEQLLYFKADKEAFPLAAGQPSPYHMEFGRRLSEAISDCMKTYYDSTLVYGMIESFVTADIWGGFRTYWSTGGRTCPPDLKYYYNRIYDPDIA